MIMRYRCLIISLIFLLTIAPVFAGYLSGWYKWLRIPPNYAKAPDILYFLILPFLGIFIIVWGLLTRLEIFGRGSKNVNMLLAFIFAISSIYYGWAFKVVHFLFGMGSFFAFGAFATMFFVGVYMFSKKKIKIDFKGSILKELSQKEKMMKDLYWEYKETKDDEERKKLKARMGELEHRIGELKIELEKDSKSS